MEQELDPTKLSFKPLHPKKKRDKDSKKRGTSAECKKAQTILQSFNPQTSEAYVKLTEKFGNGITHLECLKLAEVLSIKLDVKLDRESRRRFPILIKWLNDHWSMIEPNLQFLQMTDKDDLDEIADEFL